MTSYTTAAAVMGLTLTLGACDMQTTGQAGNSSARGGGNTAVKTVRFEGSDVQVSWDRTAKTEATLTHSTKLSIWSNDAVRLIEEATGCQARSGMFSYPEDDKEGFKSVSMPINCK